ncbi:hypothetical protein GCM10009118_10990 [Wandonia haliotis]|uniref:Photosystem I assembly protein Ycf4 n=1 Tax=Wandonia haliotis TaxID=574963 RepID=A0ABN1MN25_9FLAO
MNKGVNILVIFLIIPLFILGIIAGFDLNAIGIFEGVETPYLKEIYLVAAGIIGILLAIRGVQRWFGLRIFNHQEKFVWSGSVSRERLGRIRLYLVLENSYLLFVGLYFLWISEFSEVLGWVCLAGFTESIVFLILRTNRRYIRTGVTKQALIVGGREVRFYYFSGLRKVTVLQQSVYLEYKDELTLSFPINAIDTADLNQFKKHFLEEIDGDRVFVSEKFKDL